MNIVEMWIDMVSRLGAKIAQGIDRILFNMHVRSMMKELPKPKEIGRRELKRVVKALKKRESVVVVMLF